MELLISNLERNFNISEKEAESLLNDSKKRAARGENPVDILSDLGIGSEFIGFIMD